MDWHEILNVVAQTVVPIAIVAIWGLVRKHLASNEKVNLKESSLKELDALVGAGVAWASQRLVDPKKKSGEWSEEEGDRIRKEVVLDVLNSISKESYVSLNENYRGNVEDLVALYVEKHVREGKK